MNAFNRTAVKVASIAAAFIAVAEAANLAAQARGVAAGVAVIGMAFLACWITGQLRTYRRQLPEPQRPAPVRLPEAAAKLPEPAGSRT